MAQLFTFFTSGKAKSDAQSSSVWSDKVLYFLHQIICIYYGCITLS